MLAPTPLLREIIQMKIKGWKGEVDKITDQTNKNHSSVKPYPVGIRCTEMEHIFCSAVGLVLSKTGCSGQNKYMQLTPMKRSKWVLHVCWMSCYLHVRDDFNFPIVYFPFICNNIPAAPACGVYISQLIRYSRACGSY